MGGSAPGRPLHSPDRRGGAASAAPRRPGGWTRHGYRAMALASSPSRIATAELVPIRTAPASSTAAALDAVRMPPLALILTDSGSDRRIVATASGVAPPFVPVEVLAKSAPLAATKRQAEPIS